MITNHIFPALINQILLLPGWQAGLLKVSAFVATAGGAYAFFRFHINQLKNQKSELQRQLCERSELLEHALEGEKRAREIAVETNRSRSLLVAKINHEVRTPLNGILGMASLLAETSLTREQSEYKDMIQDCGKSLLSTVNDILVSDILEYSKVESGKLELERKDFDLGNCIEDVWDLFASRADQYGVELICELDPEVPAKVIGDNLRLQQVLMNLVESVVRFQDASQVFLRVRVQSRGDGNTFVLGFELKSDGMFLSSDQPGILPINQTALQASDKSPADVSLVISKTLIELMGGTLIVESEAGKSTTLLFTMRTVASIQSLHVQKINDLACAEGKRIMVIESNAALGNLLKIQLEQWKLVPILIHSIEEALEFLSTGPVIDIMLVDSRLPLGDSFELSQSIKQQRPQLPILLFTFAGDVQGKQHVDLFNGIIVKPLKKHLLSKAILNCCLHPSQGSEFHSGQKLSIDFAKQFPLRILIAEDNLTNQKLAVKILNKLGYNPEVAVNGKEVLELVSAKHYDVILMDVQMPEMDGLEASRMIRLCLNFQPVIIAMTANTLQGDRDGCMQAGMDDYISKPILLEELINILEKWAFHLREKL